MALDLHQTPMPPAGFFYDDLHVGLRFPSPAGVCVDGGLAALYTAISGDGLPLSLDRELCHVVTGRNELLVNPAGVRALADSRPKPNSKPRGKALLSIETTAGSDVVVDYERCPLLPCENDTPPGHTDDIGSAATELDLASFADAVPTGWNLAPLGSHDAWNPGDQRVDYQRDTVDMATSLVRITHNQAAVHRDVQASSYDGRLVYGGHTVALAQASLNRILGGLATVIGWHSCNHTAPVFEEDILSFTHTLIEQVPVGDSWCRAIHIEVLAHRPASAEPPVKVLDWTPIVVTT